MHIGSSYAVQNNQSSRFMKTSQFLLFTNIIVFLLQDHLYTCKVKNGVPLHAA